MIESGIRDRQNEIQQNQHTGDIPWWRSSDLEMKWSLDPHHSQLPFLLLLLSFIPQQIHIPQYHIHITILHSFLASTFLPLSLLPDFFHEQKTIKWQWLPVTIFEMFNDEQYLFEGKQLHFHNCSFGTSKITDYKCIFQ